MHSRASRAPWFFIFRQSPSISAANFVEVARPGSPHKSKLLCTASSPYILLNRQAANRAASRQLGIQTKIPYPASPARPTPKRSLAPLARLPHSHISNGGRFPSPLAGLREKVAGDRPPDEGGCAARRARPIDYRL